MNNRSVILLSNYDNPSVVQEINRRAKVQKRKRGYLVVLFLVSKCYMGGVDLCDQMKVSYEFD